VHFTTTKQVTNVILKVYPFISASLYSGLDGLHRDQS